VGIVLDSSAGGFYGGRIHLCECAYDFSADLTTAEGMELIAAHSLTSMCKQQALDLLGLVLQIASPETMIYPVLLATAERAAGAADV
jgi:hypothetical protein